MKYIVYKTTNLINDYIYIGVHKTENPEIFDGYIGCGVYINHPQSYEKSKTKFQKAVKEFGVKNFKREILNIFDTPEEAYELEGILVNETFLERNDVYNTILGGIINKTTGINVYQYSNTGEFIQEFNSYESAGKALNVQPSSIRRAVLYKYRIHNMYFNTDKLQLLDISKYNNINKTTVYRYLLSGELDKEYESYGDAAKDSESSPSNIRGSAILGYCVKKLYYFSFIKSDKYDKARSIQIKYREVHKYDSDGNYLCSYSSQEEAEKDNPFSNITKSIKFKTIDENNFMWGLEKLSKYNCKTPKNRRRPVGKYDDFGTLLKTWESARKCAEEVGGAVLNVLNNKYPKHKGYIYKYINN